MLYFEPVRIFKPEEESKYVYSDDQSPVLSIDVKTNIRDSTIKQDTDEYMRWMIDPIGDSYKTPSVYVNMEWEYPVSYDNKMGYKNENKVEFRGMPLENSGFGYKFVYLGMNNFDNVDWIDLDSKGIKIFFPKHAKNHPYPYGSQLDTPNWYYYWGQDVPPPETLMARIYVNEWARDINGISYAMWWEIDRMHLPNTYIYVYNSASVSGDDKTDYHWFTSKLAHENQHEYDWRYEVWGGQGYNIDEDMDYNLLKDDWEHKNPDIFLLCSTPEDRFNICYKKWADSRAYSVENSYPDKSDTNDWAYPGANYK